MGTKRTFNRVVNGLGAVGFIGAFILGFSFVLEMLFGEGSSLFARIAVGVGAGLAFAAGYFGEEEADGTGENDEN